MQDKIQEQVFSIIADALYVDRQEVTASSTLVDDLGAESIDFLDITFRLEQAFEVKIPRGDLEKRARAGLAPEDFAIEGRITPEGLENLKKAMPEAPAERLVGGLLVREIPELFTPATFERLVREQVVDTGRGVATEEVAYA